MMSGDCLGPLGGAAMAGFIAVAAGDNLRSFGAGQTTTCCGHGKGRAKIWARAAEGPWETHRRAQAAAGVNVEQKCLITFIIRLWLLTTFFD